MADKLLLNLYTNRILSDCCDSDDDRIALTGNFNMVKDNFNKFIHRKCRREPFLEKHFFNYTYVYGNDDEFVSNIGLSESGFLFQICLLLNVDRSNIDHFNINNEDLINKINERIELLKGINYYKDLKEMFPRLYDTYMRGREMYSEFCGYKYDPYLNDEEYDHKKKLADQYYNYGLWNNTSKFTDIQADFFERLVRHRDEIKEYCDNTIISDTYLDGLNKNKLKLYTFYQVISIIKNSNDFDRVDDLIEYCDKHLEELSRITDKLSINGIEYTINDMLNWYDKYSKKYRTPKFISINGTILPSDTNTGKRNNNPDRHVRELTDEERVELQVLGKRKKDFYNRSNYLSAIYEKKDETGNIAYVYPNGHILEDYIPDLNSDSSLKRQSCATYHVDIYGFEDLIGLSKTEVKNNPHCLDTLNHTDTWEERVKKIVEIPSTPEREEETKQFLKTLNRKNNFRK